MFNFIDHFNTLLRGLEEEGRYRHFKTLERPVGSFPKALIHHKDGWQQTVTVWCSNDYLGMGHHPKVIKALKSAADAHGAGAGGTRNIAGTTKEMVDLENLMAVHHGKEAALVFTSGYTANEGALGVLGKMLPDAIIFSDALNHASMISGMRIGGCERKIFPHNDIDALKKLLQAQPANRPKIVALESVYSMEGDISPLREVVKVAKEYGALVYLDEVHAVGLYGPHGAGVAEQEGLMADVDIIEGTFGKAYGVVGGYVAGAAPVIDAIRSFSSSFIFTTALPPHVLAAAAASVMHLRTSSVERETQRRMVNRLKAAFSKTDMPFLKGDSHIVPLVVGDAHCVRAVTDTLLEHYGIYVQPINYPTVPKGTERLRLTATARHTEQDVDNLVAALQELWSTHAISATRAA
ncbi:MAG: 5-aminolevulinate synthase [Proteobacteria bacterium]|nr:5-aminolevulinate synthase [Pseudomonadota bacterium]